MKNNFNVQNSILLSSIVKFSLFAGLIYAGFFLYLKVFSAEIDINLFLIFSCVAMFVANIPEIHATSNLLTLFYCRKNTKSFIKDLLWNRISLLSFAAYFILAGATTLEPSILQKISKISLGTIIQSALLIYALLVCLDLSTVGAVMKQRTPSAIQFDLKASFKHIFYSSLLILIIVIMYMLSFAVGSFLFLVFISVASVNLSFTKNFLSKKHRQKLVVMMISGSLIITLIISSFEWLNGNKRFFISDYTQTLLDYKAFEKIEFTKDKVKSVYTWTLWMNNNNLPPKEYAEAFSTLETVCPTVQRLNVFVIRCESCINIKYYVTSKAIKLLPEEEKIQRAQHLLLDPRSEYANLVGLMHYLHLSEPSPHLNEAIREIASENTHPLQNLAQKIINGYDPEPDVSLLIRNKAHKEGACSK